MENNVNVNNEQVQAPAKPQGWKDVNLNSAMPLEALVQFLNVLNQRLINVEDSYKITIGEEEMTLTEFYAKQAQAELSQKAQQEQTNQEESKAE